MLFRDAASSFIRHCQSIRKLSPHTIRAYELDVARFSQFLGRRAAVAGCDKNVIHNYVRHLFDVRSLKEASVKRHLATLRSLFRWLEEEGEGIEDPFRGARIRIRMPKRLPRVIAKSDLRRLLLHDAPHTFADLTAYVAIELLFATGMRVSELAGPPRRRRRRGRGDDLDLKSILLDYRTARDRAPSSAETFLVNCIHGERSAVRDRVTPHIIGKGNRQRRVFVPDELTRRRRQPPDDPPPRPLFRHSVATYLLEEGVDIRYVQRLLGHRSISTTEMYTHVADAALKVRITERHPRRGIVG